LAARHRRHNYRTAGQEVDIAGKPTGIMMDHYPVAIRRITDFDLPGLDDAQVDIGLTRAEDRFAISVVMNRCQGFEDAEFGVRELGKSIFEIRRHRMPSMNRSMLLPQPARCDRKANSITNHTKRGNETWKVELSADDRDVSD
jgi:hypothetical protein